MSTWEYAYIEYSYNEVVTWFATPAGNNGYTEKVPRNGVARFVLHQQIAKLTHEGWEVFHITRSIAGSPVDDFPQPGDVFHLRRES